MYRVWNFVANYSVLLIIGSVIALGWANINPTSYDHFLHLVLIEDFFIGAPHAHSDGTITYDLTLHYLTNDILMALFFFIAAKEVWEAIILKNGSLRGPRAVTPLFATFGGMIGPIVVYLGLAYWLGSETYNAVANGWAIPTATDIAFSYMVGRIIFGANHPAVRFLLLLAIADDAAGLFILAVFYPTGDLAPLWLLFSVGASALIYVLFNALPYYLDKGNEQQPIATFMRKHLSFWPYFLAGILSWYGFFRAGLHPALGLLPVVVIIPHAERFYGFFAQAEEHATDLLNTIEHMLKYPVEIILFMFGLLNAGVQFSAIGTATWLVLAGLLIGKPFGVLIFGWLSARAFGFGLPRGMQVLDMFLIGTIAAIGFTVSLFIASVAFPGGLVQDGARMGAVLSFLAVPLAFLTARLIRIRKTHH